MVIPVLRENMDRRNVYFVFPSQTSADLWARKTCTLGISRSAEAGRFLAWDRFKEKVIQERETEKKPATSVMRKLFTRALIQKNAEAAAKTGKEKSESRGQFPLKSIIPREYAGGGEVFAPFIARILPSLAYWEKLMHEKKSWSMDAEDEDYKLIKNEYSAFLERFKLFEPSWEEIKIREEDSQYIIFFPELLEDFIEYEALLGAPQFVLIRGADTLETRPLVKFQSAREEIRSAVMEIQRLHEEEGIPYEDMAVSVPELEEMEPYLLKEFSLRSIPVIRRAGKKLGETGAGRIFSLVSECAASGFSFNSFKALILNDHIPWRDREMNKKLIMFGIDYNCVSSYVQNGATVDIWEEALREAQGRRKPGAGELGSCYRELKKHIKALASSKNFREIRKYYFAFRGSASQKGLLDMEKISPDDDAVLSRCIEELGSLIDLEEKFDDPDLVPASPFGFFVSCLGDIEYVRARQPQGVNIFNWRVAAAAPFGCHFVLNASQTASAVIYQPMKFLRQDKRIALNIEDRDASGAFFTLCNTGEDREFAARTRISASSQTFSGWAIPHSFFAQGKTINAVPDPDPAAGRTEAAAANGSLHNTPLPDPFQAERQFWRGLHSRTEDSELNRIFPVQKNSYEHWKDLLVQRTNTFSFLKNPVSAGAGEKNVDQILQLLEKAAMGNDAILSISPTPDLNVFYKCSLSWLYGRLFKVKEFSLEASLLDDLALGTLYHAILKDLFEKIKNEDTVFDSRRMDTYKRWGREITGAVIRDHPAFRGPLAVPLVSPQAAGMSKKINNILNMEARFFNGYKVAELEFEAESGTGDFLVRGYIDRVSFSPEGDPIIIDYKTGDLPNQISRNDLQKIPLSEFQMPLYIKLYEDYLNAGPQSNKTIKASGAYFFSINENKIKAVMGGLPKHPAPDREEYEPFLESAEKQIEEFSQKVKNFDFVPREIRPGDCMKCRYKTICRTGYFFNA